MPRRSQLAFVGAFAFAFAALAVWGLTFRTGHGHVADMAGLRRLTSWQAVHDRTPAELVALLCNTIPYAVLAGVIIVIASVSHGTSRAVVVAAMLVVPNALTQVLKTATAENRLDAAPTTAIHVVPASWPSGHATAAMALVLAATFAVPVAYRWLVAGAGLVFAAAVGLAVVMLGWHFPSDVAGGYCVAAVGGCVGFAAVSRQAPTAARAARLRPARG